MISLFLCSKSISLQPQSRKGAAKKIRGWVISCFRVRVQFPVPTNPQFQLMLKKGKKSA